MGLRISTNMASVNAQGRLSIQQKRNDKAMSQLASGTRINSAADDAAGLAISETLKAQTRGLNMAKQNAFNATSMIQVGEGGLNEVSNILIRLRELGVQAASDNIGDTERSFLNMEASQLIKEADRISKTTKFGDKSLLDGNGGQYDFQVGANAGEDNIISFDSSKADAGASALGIDGLDLSDKGGAQSSLATVDEALVKVNGMRANFGALQNRLDSTVANLGVQTENLTSAGSRIRDTDVAAATAEMASSTMLQQAALSVLSQANQLPMSALKLM